MKFYYLLFLLVIGGLIFILTNPNRGNPQAQQEPPSTQQLSNSTSRITMDIVEENDRPVADILWFQKAAKVALDNKVPWFNVLEQKFDTHSVEGVIQLEPDPMKGEYDANEILSLHLLDEVAE